MAGLNDTRIPVPSGKDWVGRLGVPPEFYISLGLEPPGSFVRKLSVLVQTDRVII
jgi:hypothetical protein